MDEVDAAFRVEPGVLEGASLLQRSLLVPDPPPASEAGSARIVRR